MNGRPRLSSRPSLCAVRWQMQCGALADAVRCVGGCSAVRWQMRCGALADAVRCVGGCSAVCWQMRCGAFMSPSPWWRPGGGLWRGLGSAGSRVRRAPLPWWGPGGACEGGLLPAGVPSLLAKKEARPPCGERASVIVLAYGAFLVIPLTWPSPWLMPR